MTPDERLRELAKMPVLLGVDDAGLDWLATHVAERDYEAGDALITQHDHDRDCYFLIEGMVRVEIDGRDAGSFGPLDPEGEIALLYGEPRKATVIALGPCRTFVLHSADYDRAATDSPGVYATIQKVLRVSMAQRFGHPSAGA